MNVLRFCLAALLAIFAQCLFPAAAEAKWLRAETRNFIVYSSGNDKELRKFAVQLERFDATMQFAFGFKSEPNPNKLTVYFLNSQDAVAKLAGDKTGMVAGFYSPREEGSFAVATRSKGTEKTDLTGMTILFHEYAHHFMFRNFSYAYPAWYIEGFAEYLSTATFEEDGAWTVGKPAYHRAYSLLAERKLPIDQLLFGKVSEMKPAEVGVFYGRSWLLVHMLSLKPEYNGKLRAYFDAVKAGKTPREAAVAAFGDLAELDKAMDSYLKQRTLQYVSSKRPINADTSVAVSDVNDAIGQMLIYRLKRLGGGVNDRSLSELKALAAANPAEAELWYELARWQDQLASDADDDATRNAARLAAELSVDRALAIAPKHVRANVLKATLLFEKLEAARDDDPAHWNAARQYLRSANSNAIDDPLVLVRWYDSFGQQGRQPSKTAQDGLARAFDLAPEVIELRVKFAFDLANQGRFDEALMLVEFLAQHPHHSEQGQELVAQIKAMRDRAKADKT